MPTAPQHTFNPSTAKLDPLYPNKGALTQNVALFAALQLPTAPTLALAAGTSLSIGAYRYAITFVNAVGETSMGAEATITTTSANQNVNLSAIPLGAAGVTARRVYRTVVGGASGTERLLTTLNDNTTTVYADTTADASLGVAVVPATNTAGIAATYAKGTVLGELTAQQGMFKAYASGNTDGSQVAKCILQYSATVNPDGTVNLAGEFTQWQRGVPAYIGGGAVFETNLLVGLDANAVTNLGASLIQGTVAAGQLRF